ncbi:MAG TPA: ISAs1 family transposase [Oligoflexus sp.]|uniref:ISAs1 family transposase n=1 Tax=Oligoflexus sp. TaxID=1971216 RepID=UPI002D5EF69A|nr:ISAs1 family transposase [Oligoflexus sp.]HYX33222.1 ISAs1 family transposase [Oligoflexus sp.]
MLSPGPNSACSADSFPDESTVRKALGKVEMRAFHSQLYDWLSGSSGSKSLAVDGKTLKASRDGNGRQIHVLSAITHGDAQPMGDTPVDHKGSEIDEIRPLLDSIDIRGKIVTVDALHSTKDFAAWLKGKEADYVFPMKGNRKKLIDRLDMLNIKENSYSKASTQDRGHGREDKRTLYLMKELPFWLNFPTAEQAFIIERESIIKKSGKVRREQVYGLTSLKDADAALLLQLNRGHWTVENKMFYVRDVTFNEDRSSIRSGSFPHLMITLRNVIMGLFKKKGRLQIAKTIRSCLYGKDTDLGYHFSKI